MSAFSSYRTTQAVVQGSDARAFAQRLATGTALHVRVLGVSGDIDIAFAAQGAREAVGKLASRCGDRRLVQRLSKNG